MKKVIVLIGCFLLMVVGSTAFIYHQIHMETEDQLIDITQKKNNSADDELADSAGVASDSENVDAQSLQTLLKVPERYQTDIYKFQSQISADAAITMPAVSHIPKVAVGDMEFTEVWLQTLTGKLFPNGKIYSALIKNLTGDLLEIKPGFKDQAYLDWFKKTEMESQGYNSIDEYSDVEANQNFMGLVQMDSEKKIYVYYVAKDDEYEGNMHIQMQLQNGLEYATDWDLSADSSIVWRNTINDQYSGKGDGYFSDNEDYVMDETELELYSGMTADQALEQQNFSSDENYVTSETDSAAYSVITVDQALERGNQYIQSFDLGDFECNAWERMIQLEQNWNTDSGDVTDNNIIKVAYMLHYTRKVKNVPITYTSGTGLFLDSKEDGSMQYVSYETVDLLISKDGIESLCIRNLYDEGDVLEASPALLDFAQVQDIFEKNYLTQQDDALIQRSGHVTEVKLGYMRIYNPEQPTKGQLVPVWDFMGWENITVKSENGSYGKDISYDSNENYRSLMTINAIDGSIISRDAGY